MEGFIWFTNQLLFGTEEEYLKSCEEFENTRLVMTIDVPSRKELQVMTENLSSSNVLQRIREEASKTQDE